MEPADQLLQDKDAVLAEPFEGDEFVEVLGAERAQHEDLVEMLPAAEVRREASAICFGKVHLISSQ